MAGLILIYLKERVTPKRLHFLSCPTDISASEVPVILKKFASKEATSETTILKLIGSRAVCDVIPFDSKSAKGEKSETDLSSFTRSVISIFSEQLSTALSSMLSFRSLGHICLKKIWLKSSHSPE